MSADRAAMRILCTFVFLISASVLELEIALTRIFSVLTWHHFTHMILSIAMLGFGAAGSYLSYRSQGIQATSTSAQLVRRAGYFSFAILLTFFVVTRIVFEPLRIAEDWTHLISLGLYELFGALPFFFAGLCIAGALAAHQERIHTLYFWDLLGASAGSAASVICIRYLGAPGTVFFAACLAALSGVLLASQVDRRTQLRAV